MYHCRNWKKTSRIFYEEELAILFDSIDTSTPLGQRNKALLEIMYATGIRVSECVGIQLSDIDEHSSVLLIRGKGIKSVMFHLANLPRQHFMYI